jgi:large subunit ribosomal protein L18
MIKHYDSTREKRRARIRQKIRGSATRLRLCVFRSNTALFVQLIDDEAGKTVLGIHERQAKLTEKNKVNRALALGKYIASAAKEKNISTIVFDRSGYTYHGRVKALAQGLREGGLVF